MPDDNQMQADKVRARSTPRPLQLIWVLASGRRPVSGCSTASTPDRGRRGRGQGRPAQAAGDVDELRRVHFRTSVRHGANLGRQVGHWTFHRSLQPLQDRR